MKIPFSLKESLSKLESQCRYTQGIEIYDIDELIQLKLIEERTDFLKGYQFYVTPRGRACLEDDPIRVFSRH